jgi:hypothetical protein
MARAPLFRNATDDLIALGVEADIEDKLGGFRTVGVFRERLPALFDEHRPVGFDRGSRLLGGFFARHLCGRRGRRARHGRGNGRPFDTGGPRRRCGRIGSRSVSQTEK